jgi:phosphohistidine swiveling domain-containing protein
MPTSDRKAQSSVIEPPSNFPVVWERPGDDQLFWNHERMHFPEPVTPLTESVWALSLSGFTRAWAAYDLDLHFMGRRINTYHYETIASVEVPPEEQEARQKSSEAKLEAAIAFLGEDWETRWLPEIMRHLRYWETFDLRGATLSELLAHLEQTIARTGRLWEIHDLAVGPALMAISLFDDLYRDLFGAEHALEAYRLLQGLGNKTLETDRALWRLSRQARRAPEVQRILMEQPAGEVISALQQSTEGRNFLSELHTFLQEFGQRSDLELSQPRWIEDPTPVITNLKDYIVQPDRDPQEELAALATERDQLIAQTREQLRGYPQPIINRFEFLLAAAQKGTVLTEDHGFYIDLRGLYQFRLVVLEFGRRFASASVLDAIGDVFYLTLDEVRKTAEAFPTLDRHLLVAGRQAEQEYFRTIQPPPALGTLPTEPPPDDAMGRMIEKFFGPPPAPLAEANLIAGHAGSPGVVRGPARVIRSLADAERLQQGDILVTETTLPSWTPLFATAVAVVTDTGGVLSHCAIVAREYRIPAVVGTGSATTTIRDGQLIEVDGTRGIVRLEIST